jgi:uncharacterized protein (TIGR00369 family)
MPELIPNTGFMELLGMTYTEVTPDRVALSWEVTPSLHQPFGIQHGGVYCAAVESAVSAAGTVWLEGKGRVVGVSNQTDFLRPVSEGKLTAVATPVHRGRLQQLWTVEIRDERDRLISRGQVRLQNIIGESWFGGPSQD